MSIKKLTLLQPGVDSDFDSFDGVDMLDHSTVCFSLNKHIYKMPFEDFEMMVDQCDRLLTNG